MTAEPVFTALGMQLAAELAEHSPLAPLMDALRSEPRLADKRIALVHPLLVTVRDDAGLLVVIAPACAWDDAREVFAPLADAFGDAKAVLILIGQPGARGLDEALRRGLSAMLPVAPTADALFVAISGAFALIAARQRSELRGHWVNRYRYEMGEFVEIARALTTERDLDKLLALILTKARFITSADAGSVYVVECDTRNPCLQTLHFKLTQNDSVAFDAREFSLPVSERSMAGYVALHRRTLNIADVYELPHESPFGFDRSFDASGGYRTKSMLCTPLLSRSGEVLGVLQLINKKREQNAKLLNCEGNLDQVVAFDDRALATLETLASLAGVSLENALLHADNERMLEGFVRASVEAIEQRDPTTSGHSIRVASLTVALASAVERCTTGPYRDVTFSPDDLRELEYASLLHDFGKIGVREEVLLKAKKLFPHELELIGARFALAVRAVEVALMQAKLDAVSRGAPKESLERFDRELETRRAELGRGLALVVEANEPKLMSGGDFAAIEAMLRETYRDPLGIERPLLALAEVHALSVPRGSLTAAEFDEIRSHVTHTIGFLSAIPWGRKFRRVVQIAGAHHERLDGTGYPNALRASEIPLQSKIMSVSDIFDALTASDRPYKKAVPLSRALEILELEVTSGHIDAELVRVFIESTGWSRLDGFAL
ncbi:MAG: GAF domain-containing protein [Myxococcales bacterium]|nr:GAF domain-containing protein [Myxococcales bacterium]